MRKLILFGALVAMLLGATAVAGAQNDPGNQSEPRRREAAPGIEATTFCDGGVQESVVQNLNDDPVTKAEGVDLALLPGASVPVFVPTGDFDTITVTLTGQAAMTGASELDRIEVQARLGGIPMEPRPDLIGFHSGNGEDANAATWCRVIGEGSHTVEIFWRALDLAPAGTVTGTLDEYVVRVEIGN